MVYRPGETPEQAQRRRDADLHDLRMLAWLVQRNRYNRERIRFDGGRRGTARIGTVTFYAEADDWYEADRAVREISQRKERGDPD